MDQRVLQLQFLQKLNKMIKNIFFDFDGVIADSVNVKTEAFEQLYREFGDDIAKKVVEHHLGNGGMSRFEKFKFYHKKFLNIDLDEKDVQHWANRFSNLVKQGVIDAPEVKGSHSFLKEFKDKFTMFIITGTPTNESKEICKERGIYDCFKGIYGSPEKKGFWSKYLLETYKLKSSETIFVGDALADYNAAKENKLAFYLRQNEENHLLFKNTHDVIRFSDFYEFKNLIINKV